VPVTPEANPAVTRLGRFTGTTTAQAVVATDTSTMTATATPSVRSEKIVSR
jgi:hypothetical protein